MSFYMIDMDKFKASIAERMEPADLSVYLQALWQDGIGDWKVAHELVDQLKDKQAAHIHAYLHRKEGDIWNADYWYSRAGKQRPDVTLEQEWEALVKEYLHG